MKAQAALLCLYLLCTKVTSASTNLTATTNVTEVQLSSDSDFHFEILRDLSAAVYGGADIGEVLTAANLIVPGNFESYYLQFDKLANKTLALAKSIDAKRDPVSARDTFFRAATYYRSADFYLHGNQSDPRIISLWDKQIYAFDTAMGLLPSPGRRVNIQAANFTIPALFFTPEGPVKCRPTIIIGGGYDGGQEELYTQMGRAAVERGWNYISYEGPGMASPRRYQDLGFIPTWEAVVTPVVDYLHTLTSEVDTSAIALIGLSFGGLLAPRAAAFEHRLAATMAFDGLTSFGPTILSDLPSGLQKMFASGNASGFDALMKEFRTSPEVGTQVKWLIDQGTWSMNTLSPFTWMTDLQSYKLDQSIIDRIPGPILVADSATDNFFKPGQVKQGKVLAGLLGNRSTYYEFDAASGVGHAGVGGYRWQSKIAYDWFQGILDG